MTYTCTTMEVPKEVYDLIKEKLLAAGYEHAIDADSGMLDMTHIGLMREEESEDSSPLTVFAAEHEACKKQFDQVARRMNEACNRLADRAALPMIPEVEYTVDALDHLARNILSRRDVVVRVLNETNIKVSLTI